MLALDQTVRALQRHFLVNNPHPFGPKDAWDDPEGDSDYSRLHVDA
jgi:hypothetical protein